RDGPDDASLVVVDGRAWADIDAVGGFVNNLSQALEGGIGLDPAEFIVIWLADLHDAVSIGAVDARLERAKLRDEFIRGHVVRIAPTTPCNRFLLAAEKPVGTLQQVLPRQVVLA